jgi:hypothetical protein
VDNPYRPAKAGGTLWPRPPPKGGPPTASCRKNSRTARGHALLVGLKAESIDKRRCYLIMVWT